MAQTPTPKRQHYLPCTLLRGFASKTQGDESYAFCLRKGAEPFETNIKNIAVEGYFNGKPEESTLEQRFGELEGPFGLVLQELRSADEVREDLRQPITEFIAHLVVRTKHLRDSFTEGMVDITRAVERYAAQPKNRQQMERGLFARSLKDPDVRRRLAGLPQVRRIAAMHEIRRHITTLDFPGIVQAVLTQVRSHGDFAGKARKAHIDGLAKGIVARASIMSDLGWHIVVDNPATFILGDVGLIVRFDQGAPYTHAILKITCPEVVLLPISSSRLLVGYRGDSAPTLDPEVINRETAELSRDFLVASQCGQRERGYQQALGARSTFMTPDEMDDLDIGSAFENV